MEKTDQLHELLNVHELLPFQEFCDICGVAETYIIELVEMGILEPKGKTKTNWQFSILQIHRLQKAQRLQVDLKLNLSGVALILELLDERKLLQNQIKSLEHQLTLLTRL